MVRRSTARKRQKSLVDNSVPGHLLGRKQPRRVNRWSRSTPVGGKMRSTERDGPRDPTSTAWSALGRTRASPADRPRPCRAPGARLPRRSAATRGNSIDTRPTARIRCAADRPARSRRDESLRPVRTQMIRRALRHSQPIRPPRSAAVRHRDRSTVENGRCASLNCAVKALLAAISDTVIRVIRKTRNGAGHVRTLLTQAVDRRGSERVRAESAQFRRSTRLTEPDAARPSAARNTGAAGRYERRDGG